MLALAAGAARAAGPQSYSDPVGDNQGIGPDVRGATAESDGAGNVTLAVDLVSPLAGSDTLQLEIDADGTASGSPGGFEVNFTFVGGAAKAYRWNGSKWEATSSKSLTGQMEGSTVTFRFSRSEFGIVEMMRFLILGTGGTSQIGENAPDGSMGWIFQDLSPPPVTTMATTTTPAPKPAVVGLAAPKSVRAGALLVVRLRLANAETSGKVTCAARSASKPVRLARRSLDSGAATCAWRVPRTAGKTVRGSIGVAIPDLRATRSFTVRVVR
jgi:hypothetical protein